MLKNLERYHRPRSVSRAVALLKERPGPSAVLGGGTKLLAGDSTEITDVIDVAYLNLTSIETRGRFLRIGAATPIQDLLESETASTWSRGLIPEACRAISSSILLRNMSTVAGEIVVGGSQAVLSAVLLALEADVSFSDGSKKSLSLEEYLASRRRSTLGPHIITGFAVPKPSRTLRVKIERLAQLPSSVSLAFVVIALELKRPGCMRPRIAVGGASPFPVRARSADAMIDGKKLTEETISACAEAAVGDVDCFGDQHASGEYRREMVPVLVRRALTKLAAENRGTGR